MSDTPTAEHCKQLSIANARLRGELEQAQAALEARATQTCDTCDYQGHGFQAARGGRYRKCFHHSLPCEDLGNVCGKWAARAAENGEGD